MESDARPGGTPGAESSRERLFRFFADARQRLEAHGGKGEKAFPPSDPLRKPDRDGNPTGPIPSDAGALLSGPALLAGVAWVNRGHGKIQELPADERPRDRAA